MSKYEWEQGTIQLSAKEFSRVRSSLVKFVNDKMDGLFKKTKQIREQILVEGKGKRAFDYREAAMSRIKDSHEDRRILLGLFRDKPSSCQKPYSPRRKDFPLRSIRRLATIRCGQEDAFITFHKSTRRITWSVNENNHAVETAHETDEAREFFRLLGTVEWTRNTGGTIVGNDEYNEDSEYEGGGGNYVTMEFGPKQKVGAR